MTLIRIDMGARSLLVLGLALLLFVWAASGSGLLRRLALTKASFSETRLLEEMLLGDEAAVSIAIIAFDLAPLSLLIPVAFGILAWWLRPGSPARP